MHVVTLSDMYTVVQILFTLVYYNGKVTFFAKLCLCSLYLIMTKEIPMFTFFSVLCRIWFVCN